ncbi:MAG: virB8 family protein [Hyphomicrobiales bacterium]|nr:virB8 family protein [Hyphomicrobiales bacterium]MDE2115804.1 virB8 family protein [Hyphomicrobiales bacterium]
MSDDLSRALKPDRRYFEDGLTWETSIARRNAWSRSLAWVVAAFMTVIAVMALGALWMALPLKTFEPYMVVVDKSTGFVEVKRPMAEGKLTQNEAITDFNLVRYIKARETYDPKALKDNYQLAELLSTSAAARQLTDEFSPVNPQNPVTLFGRLTHVDVHIKAITFPNQETALVRFSTTEVNTTSSITRNWVALVRFQYTSAPARMEYRFQNPLGFQVTEYRRDQETAPRPETSKADAGSSGAEQ